MFERFKSRFTGRPHHPGDEASQVERPGVDAREPGLSASAPDDAALDAARDAVNAARDAAWESVGTVDPYVMAPLINPAFMGGPQWPGFRQAFRRVTLAGGVGLIASDGLADPFDDGGPSTGYGAEVYLPSTEFATEDVGGTWRFRVLRTVAQDVVGEQVALGPMLQRHGTVSMSVPDSGAPRDWLDEDGTAGVIIGVDLPGVPASIAVGEESVLLVGVVPLRPDELALVVRGGGDARQQIARALRLLSVAELASPERRSVLPLR